MKEQSEVDAIKQAAAGLVAAIMRDAGGFSLETLFAMNRLCDVAGLPDDTGVHAVEDDGEGGEPRFYGAQAAVNPEIN